jgi:hypothetical protein
MSEARLPVGKTIATFDFAAVPMVSKAQVMVLTAGDECGGWCQSVDVWPTRWRQKPFDGCHRTCPRRKRLARAVHAHDRSCSAAAGGAAGTDIGKRNCQTPDQAMTLAVIDRLVHHATILEMNVENYRRKAAIEQKRGRGRPAKKATIKSSSEWPRF